MFWKEQKKIRVSLLSENHFLCYDNRMAREKKARSAIKDVISREYTINLHKVCNILRVVSALTCEKYIRLMYGAILQSRSYFW